MRINIFDMFLGFSLILCASISLLCPSEVTAELPNLLWITSEDNNVQWVGCYGYPNADTPRIDQLANEGFRYTHCFATTPVCGPQRSTWITGVHAVSMGTQPMRSRYLIPHDKIPYTADALRRAGYYCINHNKTDYNIGGRNDQDCWDSTPVNAKGEIDYQALAQHQPFFAIVNLTHSHESSAHGSVDDSHHLPEKVTLAPYHPDLPVIRKNYAKYQDAVRRMDTRVGRNLDAIRDAGLKNKTIVIYNSDHGGVLPRSKRFLLDSGIHCPLIIRIPKNFKSLYPADHPGDTVGRIVSFIDLPKTWLSLAGAKIPDVMQGRIFLGMQQDPPRDFAVAYRDRMDERYDAARAIRDKRYLYIRHMMPYIPRGQYLAYLWRAPTAGAWQAHHQAGKTNAITGRFFRPKPIEELYDTLQDPHSIHNLAANPKYKNVVRTMRHELQEWQLQYFDAGLLPESEMVYRAAKNGITIYEMIRNPQLYPLKRLIDACNCALQPEGDVDIDQLVKMTEDPDSGIRYWGCVGLFRLGMGARGQKQRLKQLLNDPCDEVVAMVAWTLYKLGDQQVARERLRGLLESNSRAALKVANIIDWMDDDPAFYQNALLACQPPLHAPFLTRLKEQSRQRANSQ